MKIPWLALLLAAAALILSFAGLGESKDTYAEYNRLVDLMNEAIDGYNEAGAELNRVAAAYESQRLEFNAAVDAYNEVIVEYNAQIVEYNAQMEWLDRLRVEVERELGHPL